MFKFGMTQAIRASEDMRLFAGDASYPDFFVLKIPAILGVEHLFPNMAGRILGMSIGNPALWHSILALSSFLVDNTVGRSPSQIFIHLHYSLRLLQCAIQSEDINDSHIVAVLLLSYLNLAMGEFTSTGRHLDGLRLMLERRGRTDDPILNAIRRIAIRLDNTRGIVRWSLTFPIQNANTGDSDSEWLAKYFEPDRIDAIEWALAEFELENILNQMIHLNIHARSLRLQLMHQSVEKSEDIHSLTRSLLSQLQEWRARPIIRIAEADEIHARATSEGECSSPSFPYGPSFPLKNLIYGRLLIMFYRVQIMGSMILRPKPGPDPPERLEAALSLCQTFASYRVSCQIIPTSMVLPLLFAGLVLGKNNHPQGTLHKYLGL